MAEASEEEAEAADLIIPRKDPMEEDIGAEAKVVLIGITAGIEDKAIILAKKDFPEEDINSL